MASQAARDVAVRAGLHKSGSAHMTVQAARDAAV
jgi:hypothetical protein